MNILGVDITWRRFKQVFCTFFLLILCSQVTTILDFTSSKIVTTPTEEERREYFMELTNSLNELFDNLNYTIFEYWAVYDGSGKMLEDTYFELPKGNYPFYKGYKKPHPVKDLKENWISIGRMVSYNGKIKFRPGKIAFDVEDDF